MGRKLSVSKRVWKATNFATISCRFFDISHEAMAQLNFWLNRPMLRWSNKYWRCTLKCCIACSLSSSRRRHWSKTRHSLPPISFPSRCRWQFCTAPSASVLCTTNLISLDIRWISCRQSRRRAQRRIRNCCGLILMVSCWLAVKQSSQARMKSNTGTEDWPIRTISGLWQILLAEMSEEIFLAWEEQWRLPKHFELQI